MVKDAAGPEQSLGPRDSEHSTIPTRVSLMKMRLSPFVFGPRKFILIDIGRALRELSIATCGQGGSRSGSGAAVVSGGVTAPPTLDAGPRSTGTRRHKQK